MASNALQLTRHYDMHLTGAVQCHVFFLVHHDFTHNSTVTLTQETALPFLFLWASTKHCQYAIKFNLLALAQAGYCVNATSMCTRPYPMNHWLCTEVDFHGGCIVISPLEVLNVHFVNSEQSMPPAMMADCIEFVQTEWLCFCHR